MNNALIPTGASHILGQEILTVNARDLHVFLESKQDYSNWIKSRIEEYNFNENEDFVCSTNLLSKKRRGGHNRIDYHVTLDMAKELSMVERTEKGRIARKYFIECERRAKEGLKALPAPNTLTPDQQRKVQLLIGEKVYATGNKAMYPTLFRQIYRAIKDEFKVGKYSQVPAAQFDELAVYIGKVNVGMCAPTYLRTVSPEEFKEFEKRVRVKVKQLERGIKTIINGFTDVCGPFQGLLNDVKQMMPEKYLEVQHQHDEWETARRKRLGLT